MNKIKSTLNTPYGIAGYGVFQGFLVSVAYFLLKRSGHSGGLAEFSFACIAIFLLHLIFCPPKVLNGIKHTGLLIRGVLLGGSQILLCIALIRGESSTAMIAGTLGGFFGAALGNIYLKERLSLKKYGALAVCFLGSLLNPALLSVTLTAAAGGLVKGLGSVVTRKLMKSKTGFTETVSITVGVAGFLGLIATYSLGFAPTFDETFAIDAAKLMVVVFLIQYSVCLLYSISDTQRASVYTLSRIPFIIILEILIAGTFPPSLRIASCLLVVLGAGLFLEIDRQKKNN